MECVFMLSNWERGKGAIWMNNGVECMCADVWNYQSFISCGYTDGRI